MNINAIINGNSAKCAEIASELSAFGINAVMRPDFSGEILSDTCAVILDQSTEVIPAQTTMNFGANVKTFVLTNSENPLISEKKGVLYVSAALPSESIVNLIRHSTGAVQELRKIISQFLLQAQFPTNYKGYRYIVEGVALIIENPRYIYNFSHGIYPEIAKQAGVSIVSVERAIRVAVNRACLRHGKGYFNRVFGYYDVMFEPSNTEFISLCVEKIRAELL